jgi:hypothetical protein
MLLPLMLGLLAEEAQLVPVAGGLAISFPTSEKAEALSLDWKDDDVPDRRRGRLEPGLEPLEGSV